MSAEEPTWAEMDRFVHMLAHLRAEKSRGPYPPMLFLVDCWFPEELPDWAVAAAEANEPGWRWCPRISPDLLTRAGCRS